MGGIEWYCSECNEYSLIKDHWHCDLCEKSFCENCLEMLSECIVCRNIFCNECGDNDVCDDNSEILEQISNYSRSITNNYPDNSHNFAHHLAVRKNVIAIGESMHIYPSELFFLEIAALLHDIVDHKYCHPELPLEKNYTEKVKDLKEFLKHINIPDYWIKRIIIWISNISYNQELKYGYPEIPKEDIKFRNILSDADKLESLGETGILRCIEYYKFKNPAYTEAELKHHVKEFIETRLLTLDNYFRTPLGKSLSLKLIDQTKEIYKFYE